MESLSSPRVFFRNRWSSSAEIDEIARCYHAGMRAALGPAPPLVALVVPPAIDGIAMVLAASALAGSVVVLLPPEPRAWRSEPAIPAGTPYLLAPSLAGLVPDVERLGGRACLLDAGAHAAAPPMALMQAAGMVWFTSGSTGLPKPVFRAAPAILSCIDQRLATLPLEPGAGIVSGDSLAHGQGLVEFLIACRLQGAFAPLEPMNMRATLAVLRRPEFGVWFTTPNVADLFSQCPLDGPALAPALCFVAGGASARVAAAFASRFGRSLRQHYGSSEGGPVSLDDSPEPSIRRDTVGRLISGVDVAIGDHPHRPRPRGEVGRIWVRSPGQMTGYGFPPDLDRGDSVGGWIPTRDLGALNEDGFLTLIGRMDDCVRMGDGRLVNLALVASRLREAAGVREAVVLPLDAGTGATFGAMVEGTPQLQLDLVRRQLSNELPPWSWPKALIAVPSLPRLANGKIDRDACRQSLCAVHRP